IYVVLGRNDAAVLHGLSIGTHVLAGWLVYQLGRRLIDDWSGLAAAAMFVLFPASYQVAAFLDSVFHSIAADFALAAAVLYWDARILGSRPRMAAALACALAALFTHESTVAIVAFILGLDILFLRKIRGWSWWPVAFGAEAGLFLLVWLRVPRWPTTIHTNFDDIRLNGLYFLQHLTAPVLMTFGNAGVVLVAVAAVLVIVGGAALRRRLAVSMFGLLWFAAAALPACLLLAWPNYVIDASRLLYLPAPGIALFWAATLTPSAARPRLAWGTLAAAGGLASIALILGQAYTFVARREQLLNPASAVVRQIVASATQPGQQAGRIYVNVPSFLAPRDQSFPMGHYGVTLLPDYFGLDLPVAAATGQHLELSSLEYDALLRPWVADIGIHGHHVGLDEIEAAMRKGGGVYVTRYTPSAINLEFAGSLAQRGPTDSRPLATFGGWARLDQAIVERSGSQLHLDLVWRSLAPAPAPYTTFVHLTGSSPAPLAQMDGDAVEGLLPVTRWRPGDVINDERQVDVPAGITQIALGFYDPTNPIARVPAIDSSGRTLPDGTLTIPAS
ncbi:MAG: hypothetical protein JOZ39_12825, partial [Chloroflexi bacterium]|nr:hypothetical protein [Chloroflexota bacterium]